MTQDEAVSAIRRIAEANDINVIVAKRIEVNGTLTVEGSPTIIGTTFQGITFDAKGPVS